MSGVRNAIAGSETTNAIKSEEIRTRRARARTVLA
jgi:hypothetical protein